MHPPGISAARVNSGKLCGHLVRPWTFHVDSAADLGEPGAQARRVEARAGADAAEVGVFFEKELLSGAALAQSAVAPIFQSARNYGRPKVPLGDAFLGNVRLASPDLILGFHVRFPLAATLPQAALQMEKHRRGQTRGSDQRKGSVTRRGV